MWLGGLINKRTKSDPLRIKDYIDHCRKQGATRLSIDIYKDEMILFQVHPIINFMKYGLESKNSMKDKALLCFFHKGKQNLEHIHKKFKESEFLYYENPKGIHNFGKNIGHKSEDIANEIYKTIQLFEIKNLNELKLEYAEF